MSIAAVAWATRKAPKDITPGQRLVLIYLAEAAGGDDSDWIGAWPSAQTIADAYGMSRRTVMRHLQALEDRGIIRRGDQRMVASYRPDRRPIVWDIVPTPSEWSGCQNVTPQNDERGDTTVRTGCHGGPNGVTPRSERGDTGVTQTTQEPPDEPSVKPTPSSPPPGDRFDEFWSLVPRKAGIGKARTAYRNAVKRAGDEQTVIDGMRRFANDPNLPTEKRFIPHPATWLNGDRWEDEPLPPRLSTLPAESRRVAGTRPEDWDRLFDQPDQPAQGDYIDAEVVTDPWAEIEA
ncbi:helix-turn-helix domain-containing protein [Corynebacterium sp.]|uniref:helix-turn-helix domain-containing protein n=1 Tax=Corynebacterium sp. TaxID=1720 RepID=UPI0025C660D9|nr:helix-turn-helix domain-containing protein [Corynebacterium sp.]